MELIDLKGVGNKRLSSLNDAGIFTIEDLLNYYPNKYLDFNNASYYDNDDISKLILVTIASEPKVVRFKGMNYCISKVKDKKENIFNVIWYNQPYIKSVIKVGEKYFIYGKNSPKKSNTFVASLTKNVDKINASILPIYKKIGSFGSQSISDLMMQSLENTAIDSVINAEIEAKFDLISLKNAFFYIHQPKMQNEIIIAKKRLDVEKLLPLAVKNINQKIYAISNRGQKYANIEKLTSEFLDLVPYNLTNEQLSAIGDIKLDLSSNRTMNRLLQGEVGSGKTLVSFYPLYIAVKNGYQTAIIAPTEILASQHYSNLVKTFSGCGLKILHLSRNMTPSQKREALRTIKLGLVDIVVGTHAVISDSVEFKNLGLAVIDEQHRFGVAQRAKLSAKGNSVDILVMSATPIPRSMALAIYGNLSLSVIKNCPFQKDIQTNIVTKDRLSDMWKYIVNATNSNSKVFVVCSKIDDEDENSYSAENVYKKLSMLFNKNEISLLHGKKSKEETNAVMNEFAHGKLKVLVSTTIIEVGVDVPEADIMVIMSPENFGLATLHQLRGRIGRNGKKSYCFCLSNDVSITAIERLKYFRDHISGFDIAEFDYKNRGSGDIYGTSQHGFNVNFNINLSNYDLAVEIATDLMKDDMVKEKLLKLSEENYAKICQDIVMN